MLEFCKYPGKNEKINPFLLTINLKVIYLKGSFADLLQTCCEVS